MSKKNAAILFGSPTAEYGVSLHSAASVIRNFPHDTYHLITIAITEQGKWIYGQFSADDLDQDFLVEHPTAQEVSLSLNPEKKGFYVVATQEFIPVDIALLILHGVYGEGGMIQGLLDCAQIPYTGSGVGGSLLCMDKELTHILAERMGIPMAPFTAVSRRDEVVIPPHGYPCVVKPNRNGSSFGLSVVYEEAKLQEAVDKAFEYDTKVIIEDFIDGYELGCGALLTDEGVVISEIDYIALNGSEIFGFEEKYTSDTNTQNICPAPISAAEKNQIQTLTRRLYDGLNVYEFSRFDYFLGKDGVVYLNEVNTIPGFTAKSRYPRLMSFAGIGYTQIIEILLKHARCGH